MRGWRARLLYLVFCNSLGREIVCGNHVLMKDRFRVERGTSVCMANAFGRLLNHCMFHYCQVYLVITKILDGGF